MPRLLDPRAVCQQQIKEAGGRAGEKGGLGNTRLMWLFQLTVFFKTKIKVGVMILRQKICRTAAMHALLSVKILDA